MADDSILDSTKTLLGVRNNPVFDTELIIHINSAFSELSQLGVGPEDGFEITSPTDTWSSYLNNDPLLNMVKTYVYLHVRLVWDLPGTSFAIEALQKRLDNLTWRISVAVDPPPAPDPPLDPDDVFV